MKDVYKKHGMCYVEVYVNGHMVTDILSDSTMEGFPDQV